MADVKMQVHLILEILGRPAEHIKEALNSLLDRMAAEKDIKIISRTVHEPLPVKESEDLFTSFADVDVEINSLATYFGIIFAYMPANIEITSPEKFTFSNLELNELGNRLVSRLHDYDAITKRAMFERNLFAKKLRESAPEAFAELVKPVKPQTDKNPEDNPQESKKGKNPKKK